MEHSVTVFREEREHDLISSVSVLFARTPSTMTSITTWQEMKVQVRRIPWEIRRMEHTPMKGKWCNFIMWCLVVFYLCLNLYLSLGQDVSMVR